ncbi:MAG: hypothetical protein ACRYFS_00705 [Janthinobacterium lividum]
MSNIFIFDDEKGAAENWKSEIEALLPKDSPYKVSLIVDGEFKAAVRGLEERRKNARDGISFSASLGSNVFDEASMLIVDYDLLRLYQDFLTGEAVAYLARCFSQCGLIVALNQYGSNNFDLTLKGHPRSFADLNLGSGQIGNPGLWSENWQGFRPWAWPLLPRAEVAMKRRVESLQHHLDTPIFSYLEVPQDIAMTFPRNVLEYLDIGKNGAKRLEEITFRDFVGKSQNGLRGKDALSETKITDQGSLGVEMIARIAAARIGKWLERLVLPGQDLLVDTPHLASRYQSLIEGNSIDDDIECWNKLTSFEMPNIKRGQIERYSFRQADWLSRPAWWWRPLSDDEAIEEVSNPWAARPSRYVFCEDISRFLPQNESQEFVADLPSPFTRRSVADPDTVKDSKLASVLRAVDYWPQVRFSL